jgi:hypothetical protein
VSRIESPKDLSDWITEGGADLIAAEFNGLLTYLEQREIALANSEDPVVRQHAGFVLLAVMVALGDTNRAAIAERPRILGMVDYLSENLVAMAKGHMLSEQEKQ